MLWIDAGHGGAHADCRGHELHCFPFGFELLRDTAYQIQLGTHQPAGSRLRFADGLDDVLGRTDKIGIFTYLETAFRM